MVMVDAESVGKAVFFVYLTGGVVIRAFQKLDLLVVLCKSPVCSRGFPMLILGL